MLKEQLQQLLQHHSFLRDPATAGAAFAEVKQIILENKLSLDNLQDKDALTPLVQHLDSQVRPMSDPSPSGTLQTCSLLPTRGRVRR